MLINLFWTVLVTAIMVWCATTPLGLLLKEESPDWLIATWAAASAAVVLGGIGYGAWLAFNWIWAGELLDRALQGFAP